MWRLIALMMMLAEPAAGNPGDCAFDPQAGLSNGLAANERERLAAIGALIENQIRRHGHDPLPELNVLVRAPLSILAPIESPLPLEEALPLRVPTQQTSVHPGQPDIPVPINLIYDRILETRLHLQSALAGISDSRANALRRLIPELLNRTSDGSDLEDLADGAILGEIARAVDMAGLRRVAALLGGLADPRLAARLADAFGPLRPIAPPEGLSGHFSGTLLDVRQTRHGPILVGGAGANEYAGPALAIIDLGGDDRYASVAANNVQVVIDLAGNDQYGWPGPVQPTSTGLGGAVLGASLLVDHAGDDRYAGGMVTQGAAVAGVGLLIDRAGNDRYQAAELAQGAALAGIAALLDRSGDDRYQAAKFAQGYGGALGMGTLHDQAGHDLYRAGDKHPSSYGAAGRFQAFAQGVGMGFRSDVAGGFGLLHDEAGNDQYRAGNFAQGTGYYLGLGRLVDRAGNDRYRGGRYAQGAAAHLGIGLLEDRGGDDFYHGEVAANQAGAWDLALAALIDRAGDDRYQANEFALAAAAQVAIAMFVDLGGTDRYNADRDSFGFSGPTEYHDQGERAGNLAVFRDRCAVDPVTAPANDPGGRP